MLRPQKVNSGVSFYDTLSESDLRTLETHRFRNKQLLDVLYVTIRSIPKPPEPTT